MATNEKTTAPARATRDEVREIVAFIEANAERPGAERARAAANRIAEAVDAVREMFGGAR